MSILDWVLRRGLVSYCHGRLVRWGETRIQLPLRGLKRRWEMSSRIASGIMRRLNVRLKNKRKSRKGKKKKW
jgi:hypothetical protein